MAMTLEQYEKSPEDRAEDRKSGVKEGSAKDRKMDVALLKKMSKGRKI